MSTVDIPADDIVRAKRYQRAAMLLKKWAGEDPAYDERAGAALDRELVDLAMKCPETAVTFEGQDETPA
jgi:hypothetical protein